MMTTNWRDYADKLTVQQVADLTAIESACGDRAGDHLIIQAQAHVEGNRIDREQFGHLPIPHGAGRLFHWAKDGNGWAREFECARYTVGGVTVGVEGRQDANGTIEATVFVSVNDLATSRGGTLSADESRELAAALTTAAEDLDRCAHMDAKLREQDAADDLWSAVPVDPLFMKGTVR